MFYTDKILKQIFTAWTEVMKLIICFAHALHIELLNIWLGLLCGYQIYN